MELTDSTGKPVAGALDANRGRWLPDVALAYGANYTTTVTATGDDGKVFTGKFAPDVGFGLRCGRVALGNERCRCGTSG